MDRRNEGQKEFDTCFEGARFEKMKELMGEKASQYLHAKAAIPASSRSVSAVALLAASYLFGGASLVLWLLFLSRGALGVVDLGLGYGGALFLDALLSLVFFVQHSLMVRTSFKRWMARFVRVDYHGAVYTVASGIALLGLTLLWQAPLHAHSSFPRSVVLPGIPPVLMPIFSITSIAVFIWGIKALGGFDMFGAGPILRSLRRKPAPLNMPLAIRGPYRWVRHPLYFCCLLAIWNVSGFTADRLLYNLMWTGWIVVGTMLEERDLGRAFGTAYRDYIGKVPMLIPWRIVPYSPVP